MSQWRRWQDWVIVVLGVITFVTPFVFEATATAGALWAPLIVGALLFLVGLWALSSPDAVLIEWLQVLLGVVLAVVPWAFAYTDLNNMALSAWIVAAVTVIMAGWVIIRGNEGSPSAVPH